MSEYKIACLKDFLNIPADRIDSCLDELKEGLKLMHASMALGELNLNEVSFEEFTWKDDGAKNITQNMEFACGGVVQVKVEACKGVS